MYANRLNFRVLYEIWVQEDDGDVRPEVDIRPLRACTIKKCNVTLIYDRIAEIFASLRKSGSRNTMVTSDFSPEVEIRPFRACAMKNTQYNPYLWPNHQHFRAL